MCAVTDHLFASQSVGRGESQKGRVFSEGGPRPFALVPWYTVPMRFTIYGDGGSRGNPGPSGSGAIIRNAEGETVATISEFIGIATNNVAEYTAVVRALETLVGMLESKAKDAEVHVRLDSMLVVRQMNGEWKIKHPSMKPLAARVSELVPLFKSVSFEHVYRESNLDADRLANEAMDRGV